MINSGIFIKAKKNLKSNNFVKFSFTNIESSEFINPDNVKIFAEKGIDISRQYPKSVDIFKNKKFDFLITLSGSAKKGCENITANKKLHFDIEDPFEAIGNEDEIIKRYREVRNEIMRRISEIFAV